MMDALGLIVRIEESKTQRVAVANLNLAKPELLEVMVSPSISPGGATFVRTANVHFDIDPNGDVSSLEIYGPARSTWKVSELRWPKSVRSGRVRFNNPEQCEEQLEEIFETNERGDIVRIILISTESTTYVKIADGLVFGIDGHQQLVEIWIANVRVWDKGR